MRRLVFAALLCAASSSFAAKIAQRGDDWVRVYDSPCVSAETIARIPEGDRKGWGKVQGFFGGQKFFGCWRPMGNSTYILWEDGDQGIVPNGDLKEEMGA